MIGVYMEYNTGLRWVKENNDTRAQFPFDIKSNLIFPNWTSN